MNTYFKILTAALCMTLCSDIYGATVKTKKGRNVIKNQTASDNKTIKVIGPVKIKEAEKGVKTSSPTYNQAISTGAAKPEYQIGLGFENEMLTADFVKKYAKNKQITLSLGQGNFSKRNPVYYPAGDPFAFSGNTIEDKTKTGVSAAYELRREDKKNKGLLYHYGPAVYATSITTKKRKIEEILKNGNAVSSQTNYYPDNTSIEYDVRLRLGAEALMSRYFSLDASVNIGMHESSLKAGIRYILGGKNKDNKDKDIKKAYGGKNKK